MSTAEIDSQLAERYRKAEAADRHDVTHTQTVDNRSHIGTLALTSLLVALFLAATISAVAIGMAWHALDLAHMSEREGRLAQERADRLEVDVKVLLATQGKK